MPHRFLAAPNSLEGAKAHATGKESVVPWHLHAPAMAPKAKGGRAPVAKRLALHNEAWPSSQERRLHSQEPKAPEQDRFVVI